MITYGIVFMKYFIHFFFHNDDAEFGIGSYVSSDMPTSSDILQLTKNLPIVP